MSDLFGNHIVGLPTRWLICYGALVFRYVQANHKKVNHQEYFLFQHANEVFVERETSHPYVAPPSDCSTK